MKHKIGNSTKCKDCINYRAKDEQHKTDKDGFCKLGVIVNGKRVSSRLAPVYWNNGGGCREWIDAEAGLTHFEVTTRKPEPARTGAEKEYILKLLKEPSKT